MEINVIIVEIHTHITVDMYPQLYNAMQFRLDKINETKDYFIVEICERKTKSKKLSQNIAMIMLTRIYLLYLQQAVVSLLFWLLLLLVNQLE